jgi:hypothetical protein
MRLHVGQLDNLPIQLEVIDMNIRNLLTLGLFLFPAVSGKAQSLEIPVSPSAKPYIAQILLQHAPTVQGGPVDPMDPNTVITSVQGKVVRLSLGLDDGFGFPLALKVTNRSASPPISVEYSYRKAVTISGDGPHLDLIDWKSYQSPWRAAKQIEQGWLLPDMNNEEDKFPPFEKKELIQAVRRATRTHYPSDARRWLAIARTCSTVNELPCIVTLSHVTVRIFVMLNGKKQEIETLEMDVPMGC